MAMLNNHMVLIFAAAQKHLNCRRSCGKTQFLKIYKCRCEKLSAYVVGYFCRLVRYFCRWSGIFAAEKRA
jgi:hypothetical protein